MSSAISGAGLKFSSKAAEKAFRNELKEKGLAVKDGALEGFEEFVKTQKEADPEAFAPEKPAAQIVGKTGAGGDPGVLSAGARAAPLWANSEPTKRKRHAGNRKNSCKERALTRRPFKAWWSSRWRHSDSRWKVPSWPPCGKRQRQLTPDLRRLCRKN